ncbi:MAG: hypothetical protein OXU36_07865 [Candidatus Poribacteria bacterium]|nr:hypothetical protein [Candidatus Poribacteria bacterium]
MPKILETFIVLCILLCISGCGADDTEVVQEDVPVKFVSVVPPNGYVIDAGVRIITLTFNGIPSDVTTDSGNLELNGNQVMISDFDYNFTSHIAELTITWADGIQKLQYHITMPCANEDTGCEW